MDKIEEAMRSLKALDAEGEMTGFTAEIEEQFWAQRKIVVEEEAKLGKAFIWRIRVSPLSEA